MDVEGGSWAERRGGGDEGRGGEGGWIRGGWGSEIRRRLRGGGLISGEGIVLSIYARCHEKSQRQEVICVHIDMDGEVVVQETPSLGPLLRFDGRISLACRLVFYALERLPPRMPRSLPACQLLGASGACLV